MIPIRMRSGLRAGALVVFAGLLLAASGRARAVEAPREVHISAHKYLPQTITVPRGTTIRWVNEDADPHTVTAEDGSFASAGLETQDEFTFTFAAPGSYAYRCALHPLMTGTVVVQ